MVKEQKDPPFYLLSGRCSVLAYQEDTAVDRPVRKKERLCLTLGRTMFIYRDGIMSLMYEMAKMSLRKYGRWPCMGQK